MLTAELVEEFRAIFKEEYGIEIEIEDAERAAAWLVVYFDELANLHED